MGDCMDSKTFMHALDRLHECSACSTYILIMNWCRAREFEVGVNSHVFEIEEYEVKFYERNVQIKLFSSTTRSSADIT